MKVLRLSPRLGLVPRKTKNLAPSFGVVAIDALRPFTKIDDTKSSPGIFAFQNFPSATQFSIFLSDDIAAPFFPATFSPLWRESSFIGESRQYRFDSSFSVFSGEAAAESNISCKEISAMAQAAKLAANKITPAYFIFIKNKISVLDLLYKKINLAGHCRLLRYGKIFWHANWRRRNLDNTNSVPQRGHKDSDFGNMAQIFVGLLISRLFRELYLYMLKLEWAVKISSNIEIFFSPFGICGTKIFAPTLGKLVGPLCARFAKTLSFSKIDFCAGNFLRWRKMCGGFCLYAKNCG